MDINEAQMIMDKITDSVVSGDLDTYFSLIIFPYILVSPNGTYIKDDMETLRKDIIDFHNDFKTLGIVNSTRMVHQVEMLGPKLCAVHHNVSLICANGSRHCPPFPGTAVLRQEADGSWKSMMTIDSLQAGVSPLGTPIPPTYRKIQPLQILESKS